MTRYGSPCDSAEQIINIYLRAPEKLKTTEEVAYRDKEIERTLAELRQYIADLTEYRQALAARYAELETITYSYQLRLERVPYSTNHLTTYYVRLVKRLADGSELDELREAYEGKNRHKAFKRFEELKKARPGIEAVKDIEKRSWER